MQVFEFHFNPRLRQGFGGQAKEPDLIFDSFCFEPTNIYEKRMGGLYVVGLLKNVLPKNVRFLNVLAQKIKERYYKTVSSTPEKSLRDTLRVTNEHLEKIAKQGDVSWLGNLSFTVISLKNFELNFTKVGDIKIFLIRKGQIIDIDQKLKFDNIEPYPLKIFSNIVSGKLTENDIILVLSKEVCDAFLKENLLNEIAKKTLSDSPPEGIKKFKNILNGKREQLTKISGICLLMVLSKEVMPKEKETLSGKKVLKIFSLAKEVSALFSRFASIGNSAKEVFNLRAFTRKSEGKKEIYLFAPLFNIIKKIKNRAFEGSEGKKKQRSSLLNKLKTRAQNKVLRSVEHIKKSCALISFKLPDNLKKKVILVLVLALILAMGFFIFEKREERNIEKYQIQIDRIQEKMNEAESYFILAEYNPLAQKNANSAYLEAWGEISLLADAPSRLPSVVAGQVLDLKNAVSEKLYELNELVKISEPELIFEFKAKELIPQRLISFKDKIYFFTPHSENIFELNQEGEGKIIETDKKFNLAATSPDSITFFSKPDQITIFRDNGFSEPFFLESPYPDANFASFALYRLSLYFWEKENKAIIKYQFSESGWRTPEFWLAPEIKTATDFKSMAVDGSVWILTEKNTIERYYTGRLQQTISLEIFPEPKTFSKIFTSPNLPYFYILEPVQKRIIIFSKTGQIIKQFQGEKFDNLLDFSVSEDGKTIYLLNGLKVYKITI